MGSARQSRKRSPASLIGRSFSLAESSATPKAIRSAEEDDCKSSIPGCCRFATITRVDRLG